MIAGRPTVVACSALKRVYRDRIRAAGASVYFVFLTGNEERLRPLVEQTVRFIEERLIEKG